MKAETHLQATLSSAVMTLMPLMPGTLVAAEEGSVVAEQDEVSAIAEETVGQQQEERATESQPSGIAEPAPVDVATADRGDDAAEREEADVVAELQRMLAEQRSQLEEQQKQLAEQQDALEQQTQQIAAQNEQVDEARKLMLAMQTQIDQLASEEGQGMSEEDIALRERLEKLEDFAASPAELPSDVVTAGEQPGSWRIPGTNASLKIAGYVKMSIVDTFDPLGSSDRFIVGSIPVTDSAAVPDRQTSLTTRQSRLNFDVRRASSLGPLRAFIEGDFAGEGDTYRLRHAYGQFKDVLAGKTWSNFVDLEASPEEIDFEGLNGRINVRQPQLRFFPKIGENLNLILSLEDPATEVAGGEGAGRTPDLIASIRRTWRERWHIKTSVLLREIRARPVDPDTGAATGSASRADGWGLSFSGNVKTPSWDERDSFMFQLNYGDGIGRYINDLDSVGGQDGVINPVTDSLDTLKVFGGYVAYQHWWNDTMRSTFVYSLVDVDNLSFEPADAYRRTQRATGNLIWSPIPRFDIGTEILWGQRENKDGNADEATQLQLAATYRF